MFPAQIVEQRLDRPLNESSLSKEIGQKNNLLSKPHIAKMWSQSKFIWQATMGGPLSRREATQSSRK
jgi:hypothetical protein